MGNQFLSHIRETDAIVFVIRDFKNPDIIKTGQDPKDDLEVLKSELLLKDLETLDKRLGSLEKELKTVGQNNPKRLVLEILEKAKKLVEEGKWLAEILDLDELEKIKDLALLSAKKFIVVLNCDEGDLDKEVPVDGGIRICAKLEEELAGLSDDEQREYLKELRIEVSGLEKLIKKAYEVLGLATFLTAGAKEVRAWTIKVGTLAPEAAGVIHGDFERGFIAADVVAFEKFVEAGGWQKAKEKGLVKTVGKKDLIEEGQVVEFKFSI